MWKKSKPKIDSKVRFQNTEFKEKLNQARNHKFAARKSSKLTVPSGSKNLILIVCFFLLLGLVYFFYIPNKFFLKQVVVKNVSSTASGNITNSVFDYASKNSKFFLPERNLFVLNAQDLKSFLITTNSNTRSVEKITKKYPSTLEISIGERSPSFLAVTKSQLVTVSEDGVIMQIISENSSEFERKIPGLIRLKIPLEGRMYPGSRIFMETSGKFMRDILEPWIQEIHLPISYIEIPENSIVSNTSGSNDQSSEVAQIKILELWIHSPISGFGSDVLVKIDPKEDQRSLYKKLGLLIEQMDGNRKQNLVYVDMRFKNRGFLCLENAPCADLRTENVIDENPKQQ